MTLAVANIPDAGQATVTLHVEDDSPVDAGATALAQIMTALELGRLLAFEVVAEIEYERRASLPTMPELVGASEAAEILGVSRQRVHQLYRENAMFPAPLVQVAMGPLWDRKAIEAFRRRWERRPGRPRVSQRGRRQGLDILVTGRRRYGSRAWVCAAS